MAERLPHDEPAGWSDAALVAAMRREEHAAVAQFYARFSPFLHRCARLWGVAASERDTVVDDVLADVALALMRHTRPVPRSLAAYLATALRHRLGAAGRAERRERVRREGDAADVVGATRGGDAADGVLPLCSEDAWRSARGPGGEEAISAHPAVVAFVRHLEAVLPDDDRLLLAWLAHHVPLRTAAAWLGVSYEGACKRAQRLRARLRAAALAHLATLPPVERRVVARVLERGDAPAAIAGPPPPPSAEEHP